MHLIQEALDVTLTELLVDLQCVALKRPHHEDHG